MCWEIDLFLRFFLIKLVVCNHIIWLVITCATYAKHKTLRYQKRGERDRHREIESKAQEPANHLWPSFGFKLMIGSSSAPLQHVCVYVRAGDRCGRSDRCTCVEWVALQAAPMAAPCWLLNCQALHESSACQHDLTSVQHCLFTLHCHQFSNTKLPSPAKSFTTL